MSCELCGTLKNEGYRVLVKNDLVALYLNNQPIKEGHLLVSPLRHAENLSDLEPDEAKAFLQAIDQCMEMLSHFTAETPLCVVNGWGHRTQPHLHAHVLPTKAGIRGMYVATEGVVHRRNASIEELKQLAEKLRPLLKL